MLVVTWQKRRRGMRSERLVAIDLVRSVQQVRTPALRRAEYTQLPPSIVVSLDNRLVSATTSQRLPDQVSLTDW